MTNDDWVKKWFNDKTESLPEFVAGMMEDTRFHIDDALGCLYDIDKILSKAKSEDMNDVLETAKKKAADIAFKLEEIYDDLYNCLSDVEELIDDENDN